MDENTYSMQSSAHVSVKHMSPATELMIRRIDASSYRLSLVDNLSLRSDEDIGPLQWKLIGAIISILCRQPVSVEA